MTLQVKNIIEKNIWFCYANLQVLQDVLSKNKSFETLPKLCTALIL